MRRLVKEPKPPILVSNEEQWTAAYLEARNTNDEKKNEKWRHVEIKRALRIETRGKCAYCEARIEAVSFLAVEHIVPKSARPDLAHSWENLTGACNQCNTAKGSYHRLDLSLVNPYADEVGDHLVFVGDLVDWRLESARGHVTVLQLRLNRIELVQSRIERIKSVRMMIDAWARAPEGLKDTLASTIRLDIEAGEFSASVSAYATAIGFPIPEAA